MSSFFIFWPAIGAGIFFCLEFAINTILSILNTFIDPESHILRDILIVIAAPIILIVAPSLFGYLLLIGIVLLVGSFFGITQILIMLLSFVLPLAGDLLILIFYAFYWAADFIIFILEKLVKMCENATTFFLQIIENDAMKTEI